MQRLSPQSMLKAVGGTGSTDSSRTPQRGLTQSDGQTSLKAREWLEGKTPQQVDAAIRHSLTSQLGVVVSESREWRFPEGKPAYAVTTSAGLKGLSTETRPLAIRKLETAMTPPSRSDAEGLMAQMQAVLARRNNSADTSEMALDIYVHVLTQHPADIAKEVVRRFIMEPRANGSWFPAPAEIEEACRNLTSPRQSMLNAIRAWREPSADELEARRLEGAYRALQDKAMRLGYKVGPGPAQDTGERGERIAAWKAALAEATKAKEAWLDAERKTK